MREFLLFKISHLFRRQTELVALGLVQTQQVPQFSFLIHPVQEPHRLRLTLFFLAIEVGESERVGLGPGPPGVRAVPSPPSPVTVPFLRAVPSGRGRERGAVGEGSVDTGAGLGRKSSKRKTGG